MREETQKMDEKDVNERKVNREQKETKREKNEDR